MKRIYQAVLYAALALVAPLALQSCDDAKDLITITDELPLKVDHLYMVGDATPAGWSIDNPTEMTKDSTDKFVFTYHGRLNVGEVKFPFGKGDWGATFAYAPASGTEINANGVASTAIDVRKGGDDNKWKVTLAGIYTLTINLRDRTIAAAYEGAEPVEPIQSAWLTFIGDATPWGWNNDESVMEKFQKTSDAPLQFTYEGHLNAGEFKLVYDQTDIAAWSNYIQAPEKGVTLSRDGVSKQGMTIGGTDNKWRVAEAGTYTLVFDLTARTVSVTAFTPDATRDPWATTSLYLIGGAGNGWSIGDALALKPAGDHTFVYAGALNEGTFKLMATNTGDFGTTDKDWFYAPAAETAIGEGGAAADGIVAGDGTSADNQWKVTRAGNYVLTLDMAAHKLTAEYVGPTATSIATAEARLVGDATPTGWNIAGTAMTKATASPLTFTWQGALVPGEFKIALTSTNDDFSGDWLQAPASGTEVGPASLADGGVVKGGDDNKWRVTTAGTYKITVNFSAKTISVSYVGA